MLAVTGSEPRWRGVERIVSRAMMEFIPPLSVAIGIPDPADYKSGVVVLTLLHSSGGFHSLDDNCPMRPVSVLALAETLRVPYATMQRMVQRLIKAGVCERTADGVVVSRETKTGTHLNRVRQLLIEGFTTLLYDLATVEFDFETLSRRTSDGQLPPRRAAPAAQPMLADAGASLLLRAVETRLASQKSDWDKATAYGFISAANVEHITHDPALAWRYATTEMPVPSDMRRPISVLALSKRMALPYETTRRLAGALVREGRCELIPKKGLIVPASQAIQRAAPIASGVLRFAQIVEDLKRANFSFETFDVRSA